MRGTMMDYPLTLIPILERAGRLFGHNEIVTRLPDRSLHRHTYADFYRRTRALAESLHRMGLQRGDRVGTLMWNNYVHLEAYFAIPCAGGVLHTLNLRLHPNDLAYIVNHAQDRFLIVDDVLLPLYEKFKDQVKPERVLVAPLSGRPVPEAYENYEAVLAHSGGTFRYPELDENDAAAMCYTSGTTGMPKGVAYSHRAMVLHSFAFALADATAISQRDVLLPVVPMFHGNAWGAPYAGAMVGAKQVLPGPYLDAESLLDLFERERVTFSAGVPTVWLGVLEALDKNPDRWKLAPGMRMAVAGSAPPEAMIRRLDRHGLRLIHAYGLTETTPLATICNLKRHMDDWPADQKYQVRAMQGLPLPFVETRVVNDQGEAPWDGKTLGELQLRGPWIAAGYYNLPEESQKWTEDGWFRTGDVAAIDAEGYVRLADRTKDLIKSGGEWISSVDLENALMGHPAVKEAAVIAIPHPKWDERPLAVVVLKDGVKASSQELGEFLAAKFAKWQIPDDFVFVSELPHTSTGKLQKIALREKFRGGRAAAAAEDPTP